MLHLCSSFNSNGRKILAVQLLGLLLPVDLVCRIFTFCLLNGNDKQTILTRIFLVSNGTLDITVVPAL